MVCLDFFVSYTYIYICLFFASCLPSFFVQTSHDFFFESMRCGGGQPGNQHQGIPVWEHRFWKPILGPGGH